MRAYKKLKVHNSIPQPGFEPGNSTLELSKVCYCGYWNLHCKVWYKYLSCTVDNIKLNKQSISSQKNYLIKFGLWIKSY